MQLFNLSSAGAEVLGELDKDEDWKVHSQSPSLLLPFYPLYSYTEQFIATLRSSLSTEIKVSVSFSFNIFSPSFPLFPFSLHGCHSH